MCHLFYTWIRIVGAAVVFVVGEALAFAIIVPHIF